MTNKFIVFEGIEACGKSTQAKILKDVIEKKGGQVWMTEEPTPSNIGKLIRYFLKEGGPDSKTLSLLFTADRNEHIKEIKDHLNKGEWVICDRYIGSTFAYQGMNPYDIYLNKDFLMPSLTIYLSTSINTSMERLSKRNGVKEIFDREDILKEVKKRYEELFIGRKHPDIIIVNGDNEKDIVSEEIKTNIINWAITNNYEI